MEIKLKAYEVKQEEELKELKSTGLVLEHKKSGARIAAVLNDDTNKVFSIGFRTPPADSTGVAHIIEHTVLCGSREFPAKDPFVELVKGSMNTFLNAMTYSDKTLYPVASCNDKDFQNLMHVYLDAVFYPEIYRHKEIFMQEGWHYELEAPDSPLKYNGVVYNEMKGVFSSPEQILFRTIQASLFPDTTYGKESGGEPEHIPELTREAFLDFHRKYYHPSNSYIYLYGNLNLEEKLDWMDRYYLSAFDRIEPDSRIGLQKPFDSLRRIEAFYSLAEDEEPDNKAYLSYNTAVGTSLDRQLYLAFQVLEYALLGAPGAPLKQALLDAGIGSDVLSDYDNGILQPVFAVIAKGTQPEREEEFLHVIRETLEALVREGLDEKLLRAAINFYEFKYREADFGSFPKGLMYGIQILDSWLYDDEKPFIHIRANETFTFLKDKIGTGYFENLISTYLLSNPHSTLVMVKPQKGLTAQMEDRTAEKLKKIKEGLSTEEINALVAETQRLRQYQEEPTPDEILQKIPMLTREDLDKKGIPLINEMRKEMNTDILFHEIYTNGIGYVKLAFRIDDLTGYAPYLSLLSNLLGNMGTEHYSFLELSNEVNIHTGGIFTDINIYNRRGSREDYRTCFEVTAKALYKELPHAFSLIEEMLFHTEPGDGKRLKEIISETRSRLQMKMNSSGNLIAANRAMSYFSESANVSDHLSGVAYYRFLTELEKHFEERKEDLYKILRGLMEGIFRPERLLVGYTSDEEGYKALQEGMPFFLSALEKRRGGADSLEKPEPLKKPAITNEGFKTPGQVQYVARAGNYLAAGERHRGTLKVLRLILSYDYLWLNVRVKGGAYGCGCGFSYNGDAYLVSYRDPELAGTNRVFEGTAEYVKNFDAGERDMTKYVIGTISQLDTPLNPSAKGNRSFAAYMSGITQENLQKEREEILTAGPRDIRDLAEIIQVVIDNGSLCVIGNEQRLLDNKELFGGIEPLL